MFTDEYHAVQSSVWSFKLSARYSGNQLSSIVEKYRQSQWRRNTALNKRSPTINGTMRCIRIIKQSKNLAHFSWALETPVWVSYSRAHPHPQDSNGGWLLNFVLFTDTHRPIPFKNNRGVFNSSTWSKIWFSENTSTEHRYSSLIWIS